MAKKQNIEKLPVKPKKDEGTWPIDLTPNQTKTVLKKAYYRFIYKRATLSKEPLKAIQILYKGKWLFIGSTDLKEDKRSVMYYKTYFNDVMGYYINQVNYGARVTSTYFYIITAFSDG